MTTGKLETKRSPGWTNADGSKVPPHTLYRYTGPTNPNGVWYSTPEAALKSYERSVTRYA